jgi:hypothetical protein
MAKFNEQQRQWVDEFLGQNSRSTASPGAPGSNAPRVTHIAPTVVLDEKHETKPKIERTDNLLNNGNPPPSGGTVGSSRADGADPWKGLSDGTRRIVDEMWTNSEQMMAGLRHSQEASGGGGSNLTRAEWREELSKIQVRINALDADAKVPAVKQEYENFVNKINAAVVRDLDAWEKLNARYQEEYSHLSAKKETDFQEAAKALKDRYEDVKRRLDRGAIDYITSEDYLSLKEMLDSKYHIDLGILRGARNRWKKYQEMLRVVEELKREGEDADKYVPGWSKRTQEEIDHLQTLINAKITRGGDNYSREFKNIRDDLATRFDDAKRAHKPEKSIVEKGVDLVGGGIEAIVGPIIEAAKQVVDLVQICMHFASLGNYEPSFTSDMAEAAKQGATTGDLLKGMVTGLIETPERLYKAIEAGDWKAIGRETVNIYMLAKSVREIPDIARRAPAIVARTARAIRMLKARKLALELHEGKMLPQAAPKTPTQPVPGPELHKVAKSPPKGEPTILKDPPAPDTAPTGRTTVKAPDPKGRGGEVDPGKTTGKRPDPIKTDKTTGGDGKTANKGRGPNEPTDKGGGDPAKSKPTGSKQTPDADGKGPPPKQPVATPSSKPPGSGPGTVPSKPVPEIPKDKLGKPVGSGGNKNAYEYGDNKVVAVLKEGKKPRMVDDELAMLNQLKENGIPTVNAERVNVGGRPALLMDKFEGGGSKSVVALDRRGKMSNVGDSPYLNERSIADLNKIRNTLTTKPIKVDDLQFLIGKDGRVVVADPLKVTVGGKPSKNNLLMIDKLIAAAKKSIAARTKPSVKP